MEYKDENTLEGEMYTSIRGANNQMTWSFLFSHKINHSIYCESKEE